MIRASLHEADLADDHKDDAVMKLISALNISFQRLDEILRPTCLEFSLQGRVYIEVKSVLVFTRCPSDFQRRCISQIQRCNRDKRVEDKKLRLICLSILML